MEKKQFAFLLMGPEYGPEDTAHFETKSSHTWIFTVNSFEEAYEKVKELAGRGFGAIELCGAFGEERAREIIALTGGKIAVGFVTHLPGQDALFSAFFGD